MDFIAPDILSPFSGSPVDGGVKPIRATTSSNSGSVRKSFSAVLQGVRGEERRGEARETDTVRSTNKSDREPSSKEARGLDASSAQTEQAEASPSRAENESRSSDKESTRAEVPTTAPEAAGQESNAGSDVQGQKPESIVTVVPFQPAPEAIGEPEVRTEGEIQTEEEVDGGGEVQSVVNDAAASDGSSKSPLISLATMDGPATVSDSAEDRSTPNKTSAPLLNLPEQNSDAAVIQPKHDSQAAQVIRQSSNAVVDDSASETVNLAEHSQTPVESQPGSAPPNQGSAARRAFHAYLGAISSNSKAEPSSPDSGKHDGVLRDQPVSSQDNWYAQSVNEGQGAEGKTRWVVSHGQQSSNEGTEHFSEFWNDQQSRQHGQTETKLPQAAVAELQVSNGQSTESIMAGAHGRVVASPQPPSPAVTFASQAQPAVSAHNTAETSAHVMARSVVLNVAQPDLGHVNIRVAMANDVVHAHLSADRPEVGQFLINGQDRLQAAFQANGLDMGQFRVDIDRQGGGRSFQHGPSQEQGQSWNQDSQGMKWGQSQDRQDEQRSSLHGLLNVVA